jgi:hypothetical protein
LARFLFGLANALWNSSRKERAAQQNVFPAARKTDGDRTEMNKIAFVLAVAATPFLGATAANAAPANALNAKAAAETGQTVDVSARKKVHRHRHVQRSYLNAYGYDRPYSQGYYGQGYYRGIRPGWGYGPDPGDRAWPPFHFRPYW